MEWSGVESSIGFGWKRRNHAFVWFGCVQLLQTNAYQPSDTPTIFLTLLLFPSLPFPSCLVLVPFVIESFPFVSLCFGLFSRVPTLRFPFPFSFFDWIFFSFLGFSAALLFSSFLFSSQLAIFRPIEPNSVSFLRIG